MRRTEKELLEILKNNTDLIDRLMREGKNEREIAAAIGLSVSSWKSAKKRIKSFRDYCTAHNWRHDKIVYERTTKICLQCGETFKTKHYTRNDLNRFCSRRCSSLFYGNIKTEESERREATERQAREAQKIAARTKRQFDRITKFLDLIKPCEVCGKINYRRKYCKECKRRHDNAAHDKRLYRNGTPDLSITLEKVYERDLGICQHCKNVLIFGNDTNADFYPSIDHIKPLSKGGLHSWDNVQLLCRKCNALKGNREDVAG